MPTPSQVRNLSIGLWILLLSGVSHWALATPMISTPPPFLSRDLRVQMLVVVNAEMLRLDGEGFFARTHRSKTWTQIVEQAKREVSAAQNWDDFNRAVRRLDAAYTNLHSYVEMTNGIDSQLEKPVTPLVRILDEWLAPDEIQHVIGSIDGSASFSEDVRPIIGDQVIAINGRPIEHWEDENFNYCKWPLKSQCDFLLSNNLEQQLLSWNKKMPLYYTLKRGEKVWTIKVPLKEREKRVRDFADLYCASELNRYPGYVLAYSGNRACIYQDTNKPHTAILRITSFHYSGLKEGELITSIEKEIEQLYPWWQQNAHWQHLVIDVIDNGGGNAPIPYYNILFQTEYQEQFTAFKKIPELLDPTLRESVFWGSTGQEMWFQNILSSKEWDDIPMYDFLPPIPMFCSDEQKDCRLGLFKPSKHPFTGRISILLNENCISSCDGFVYALKENLGNKVKLFGHPQAADSAYSRLTIEVGLNPSHPGGVSAKVVPISSEFTDHGIFHQTVSTGLAQMAKGVIVAGRPLPIDGFVPQNRGHLKDWPQLVLTAALEE